MEQTIANFVKRGVHLYLKQRDGILRHFETERKMHLNRKVRFLVEYNLVEMTPAISYCSFVRDVQLCVNLRVLALK